MASAPAPDPRPHVLILGAGFGGLYAAFGLAKSPVRVTVVDRKNHHTFQPLLYQVATAGLSPGDIATPIRRILRRQANVEVFMGEALAVDLASRGVTFRYAQMTYDYLIVATGATHSYFSHPEWEQFAPGLKTVEDAIAIRRRILLAFERAEREQALNGSHEPLNFVIVGAGPTGVELAGAIAEISRRVLRHDFRSIDPTRARVLLLEGAARVLPAFPADLSAKAERQLRKLGVEVRTGAMVTDVQAHAVKLGAESVEAALVLWAAGVKASPLGAALQLPSGAAAPEWQNPPRSAAPQQIQLDGAGRVRVQPDCSLPGHTEVFVIGDLACLAGGDGEPLPGVAQVAIQMGRAAARNIARDLQGRPRQPFHYADKGILATIGRAAAVGVARGVHISGLIAWLAWLFIHIYFLIGFRNRVLVILEWAWAYLRFERAARLITGEQVE